MSELYSLFYETKGICTDTRNILPDSLFIALKGINFNGNLFAENAIQKGAKFAIVDQEEIANDHDIFYVPSTLKFLQDLFLEVKSCYTSRTQSVVQAAIITIDVCLNTQLKLMETSFE